MMYIASRNYREETIPYSDHNGAKTAWSTASNQAAYKSYYIGNIKRTVKVESIRRFLERDNVKIRFLKLMFCTNQECQAAKLEVKPWYSKLIESKGFWPEGVYIRRWFPNKEQ